MTGSVVNIIIAIGVFVLLLGIAGAVYKRRPRTLKTAQFQTKWAELQKMCKDQKTWPLAVIDADKLLDDALKKRRFKGKTMGERLVSAQRAISNNDGAWFGHKLRNRLVHEQDTVVREKDIKQALVGIRQALKDLGALR